MTNTYTLGKNGKFGEIDFSKLKSGITKEDLGIEEGSVLDSIWKQIDTNQEGDSKDKLDRQELNEFIKIISVLCGKDNNLSTGEAKKFETEDGKELGRKHKEELLTFLARLSELTENVAKVETETATNIEIITYEDGHTEKVKPDGSKTIISKDGKTITEKDANGNTTKETVKTDNGETVIEYESGSTNPKKKTIIRKDSKSVILYVQGRQINETKTINETGEVQEYDIVGERFILKKITNPKTGETIIYHNGKAAIRTVTTQTGKETRVSNTMYDGNNSTENISINGTLRYQKKVINGKEYEVRYDENGNTIGVIVQYGESVRAIAEKFGVKPEDLVKANAHLLKGGKQSFNAGDEIVIPREMQADEYAKAQEGRKDAEGVKADYRAAVARRKAEAARREAQRQATIGTEIARGENGYYVTRTSDGSLHYWNPQKKEISAEEFKKHCPTLYKSVTEAQRGATKRTRKKYDTATIKKQSNELARKIHTQISGASKNENTINMLRGITPENAAFVVSEYQRMYGVSLAKDIDEEWGLDLNTVKTHVCKKLVEQAKKLGIKGIYYGDYQKINDLNSLQNWINKVASKIINTMSNATETYYATDAEETQRQKSAENAKTAKASAEQIVNDLIKNAEGWNDINKIKAAIARIDNPEELKEVNRLLTLKGYPPTDKYSPIENFIYQETNHDVVHRYNSSDYLEQTVQNWIDNGTLKGQEANQAQARMAARVLYDGGDGFGTNEEKIKKAVRMIKCPKPTGNREADNKQAREVYRLVNAMIRKHNTFYGLGSPCTDLLDYCEGEMWDSEVKYLKGILAETNAIQGKEKAQAIKDLTQEAVEGAGTDIEELEQALKGIDSPEDRKAVEAKLKEYCIKKGIKPQIAGQAYLQAILYDECDTLLGISTDHKEIRKFNEMLIEQGAYTEAEIVNLRAEQAALQILEGDFSNIKDAVEQIKDPKVLAKVEQLLTTKGYKSLDEFLSKKLNQTKSDLVNAELASNNLLPNEKAANVAYRLMKNSDFDNRAMGVRAIRNEVVAKMVDEKLRKDGSSLAQFMEQFNKEKAEYKAKADFWDGWGKFLAGAPLAEYISDEYRENTDTSDNMFVEMQSAQVLTPQQKETYARTVKLMEQKLAQMEKDYKAALDSQGVVSRAVNQFCENYGIGTTKEEIEARIEHDKETIRLLKLAAEGKLGKMVNGKTVAVSFEAVFKERNIGTNFNAAKVEKVENQAQMLVAMNYAKTNIAVCWEELENGLSSSDSKRLSVAIIDTLEKLSNMTGKELSLAGYGYSVKNGIIVDSSGKPVPVDKLRELANQLKRGLSDVAKDLLGKGIPLNTSSSKINNILEESYNKKKESFKQEFKNAFGQDCPDEMVENYISTIETGRMVVNMGALIGAVVAAPFTGGGSLAVFAAGAGVSLGLNALEHSTDANGWTNAEWTSDAEQALWDGLLAAVGLKVGVVADAKAVGAYKTAAQVMLKKFAPNITEKTLERASVCIARVRAMGYEVSSDTIQSLVQTYCQYGEFDEESFVRDLLISVAGNTVGHTVSGVGEAKKVKYEPPKGTNPEGIVPKDAKKMPDGTSQYVSQKDGVEITDTYYYDADGNVIGQKSVINGETHYIDANGHTISADNFAKIEQIHNEKTPVLDRISKNTQERSVGKLNDENYAELQREVNYKLEHATTETELDELATEINKLQVRDQRRPLLQQIEAKKAELHANSIQPEAPHVDAPENVRVEDEVEVEVADAAPHVDEQKTKTQPQPVEAPQTPQSTGVKSYSEMDENELFSEYKRLNNEFKYGGLSKTEKTARVKELQKIKSELEAKGFSIEGDKLVKNKKAHNVFNNTGNSLNTNKSTPILTIEEVVEKYGKKIGKRFKAVLKSISKISEQVDVDKIVKYIKEKFSGCDKVLQSAVYFLKKKAELLGLKIKDTSVLVSPETKAVMEKVAAKHHGIVLDLSYGSKKFQKGNVFVVDLASNPNTQFTVGGIMTLDLNEPKLKYLLENLKEGESFTIGSWEGNAKYKFGSNQNGVSREHLRVTKENGVLVFEDLSTFGTVVDKNYAEPLKAKDIEKMFNNNQIQSSYYIGKIHENIYINGLEMTPDDYKDLAKLMNKSDGKYISIWQDTCQLDNGRNIDKLAVFMKLAKKHGTLDFYLNLDARSWDNIVNNICQKTNPTVNAIRDYKASSRYINETLSKGYTNNSTVAGYINAMTEHINTQVINKKMRLYRGEQYNGTLSLIKFPNGQSLGDVLENLIRKKASPNEIRAFVNKYLVGTNVKQNRFMSTALNEDFCIEWAQANKMGLDGPNPNGAVVWDIDVPSGTRGCFVEDYNTIYTEEYEFILQRESSLIIKDAYFDENKNVWIIKATVEQPDIDDIKNF